MHPASRDTQTAYQWGDGGVGWPLVEAPMTRRSRLERMRFVNS